VTYHAPVALAAADVSLFADWSRRCRAGSPMLVPVVRALQWLLDDDATTEAARQLLELLPDADLLLPGIDEALRARVEAYAEVGVEQ